MLRAWHPRLSERLRLDARRLFVRHAAALRPRVSGERAGSALFRASTAAALLVAVIIGAGPMAYSQSLLEGLQIDRLWRDSVLMQISGYTLLGLSAIGLSLSVRKRWKRLYRYSFRTWRLAHAVIDAKRCITCHQEHRPGMTRAMGVTIADDHCMLCHAGVGKERPSHRDLTAASCATGGCHNYHDNSALYEDFLIKHLDHAATFPRATLPPRDLGAVLLAMGNPPRPPLGRVQQDAPLGLSAHPRLITAWSVTNHARGGINCTDCHGGNTASDGATPWQDNPGAKACRECHESESDGFERGKHGMRLKHHLPPMTPESARQPMKSAAAHKDLTCNSCHRAHSYDTKWAAVEACTDCHDDRHTRAYRRSPHARLWRREITREDRPGSGVSCATCHLPREITRRGGQSLANPA